MLGPSAREVVHEFASHMTAHTNPCVVRVVEKGGQMLRQHLMQDVVARLWTDRGHERRGLQPCSSRLAASRPGLPSPAAPRRPAAAHPRSATPHDRQRHQRRVIVHDVPDARMPPRAPQRRRRRLPHGSSTAPVTPTPAGKPPETPAVAHPSTTQDRGSQLCRNSDSVRWSIRGRNGTVCVGRGEGPRSPRSPRSPRGRQGPRPRAPTAAPTPWLGSAKRSADGGGVHRTVSAAIRHRFTGQSRFPLKPIPQ